jgi:capsular exopolysaccharide synthesis family protein
MASEFLTKQISELRQTLDNKSRALQEYGKRKEIFPVKKGEDTTVINKLQQLNNEYTNTQINRVNKETEYRELKNKPFTDYPEVLKNPVINDLKNRYSRLEGEYKKKSELFKPEYPEMQQLLKELDTVSKQIETESRELGRKILKEAETQFNYAFQKETELEKMLKEHQKTVVSTNNDAIYYESLQIEVENIRTLLEHLVKKEKESMLTSRLEGIQTSNIKVIDYAEVPISPVFPNPKVTILVALFLGLIGGVVLVIAVDWLDQTFKNPEDVEKLLKIPCLGFIPMLGDHYSESIYSYNQERSVVDENIKEIEMANYVSSKSVYAENYGNIRTSILMSTPNHPPQVITVTSAAPREGKTATLVNLAISFTKLDKKVLLIDGDMRRPRLHKVFKLKNLHGLSSLLVGRSGLKDIIAKSDIENLYIIPSGPIPPNPSELLNTKMMEMLMEKCKEQFDFIFIDSPPMIGIVDPLIIGNYAEGIILITWGGKTHKKAIEKAKRELDKYRLRVLGMVLNKVRLNKQSYRYYSQYSYNYQYVEKEEEREQKKNNKFIKRNQS